MRLDQDSHEGLPVWAQAMLSWQQEKIRRLNMELCEVLESSNSAIEKLLKLNDELENKNGCEIIIIDGGLTENNRGKKCN